MRMTIVAMCMILSACVPMHTKQLYDSGVSYQDDGTVSVKRCDRMYVHSIHSLFQLQPFGANNFMDRNCHTLTGSIDDVNSSIKKYDAPSNELDKEFTAMKSSPYTGRGRSPGMFMGSYISAIEYDDNGKMYTLIMQPVNASEIQARSDF